MQIPIRVINVPKIQIKKSRRRFSGYLPKIIYLVILGSMLIAGQSFLFSGYEAHVINVTARICRYSETRTIGFWKTHQELYVPYIPLSLGDSYIGTPEAVDQVFQNANAVDMADMLRAQLLAMKFNIAHYGVGEYVVEGWGTINYIVGLADKALTPSYNATREQMKEIKDALDFVNKLHRLSHCLDIDPGTEAPVFVIQGAPEPTFSGEPFIAGASVEPPAEELPEPACGNEVLEGEEECDDGNLDDGDGCSATCIIELPLEPEPEPEPEAEPETEPVCGDGVINQETEQCDDGLEGSETCSIECTIIESEPEPEPVCGDGVKEETEECDGEDGVSEHYTCTEECSLEYIPYCGDEIVDDGEECDDGLEGSENCSIECTIIEMPEPICGDNNLDEGEECDDGNLEDGDGCSATCTIEELIIE